MGDCGRGGDCDHRGGGLAAAAEEKARCGLCGGVTCRVEGAEGGGH